MSEPNAVGPTTTWMHVVAILTAAADTPPVSGPVDPDLHSLALGAQIVASRATALLPIDADSDLDDVVLDVTAPSVRDLIRAAANAAHRHPIEELPAGAAAVIAELDDLVAQAEAVS
jgi:hypothetical protein